MITIIVLMILAGVSLSFVLGDNGILKKAQETADAYKNASQSEQQTLQNIEDYLYGEKGGNNTGDNATGGGNIPAGLKVGSTVSYAPTGTYNWQAQYYASADSIKVTHGWDADAYVTENESLDSSTDDYKINTWRVFEIDKVNQKVTLVPNDSTSKSVILHGAQGYNNGVKLLNDTCNNLYSMPSKGITARSINLEDIENKMTASALVSARGEDYLKQASSACSKEYSYYPSIYAQEKLSVIDGTKRSTGLDRSEQKTLIGRTDNGATEGHLQASTSIQPYKTGYLLDSWFGDVLPLKSSFQTDTESGINYSELLAKNGYWLASRGTIGVPNYSEGKTGAVFCLYYIGFNIWDDTASGGILLNTAWFLFSSSNQSLGYKTGLFPIVTVPANLIVPDGENFKVE